MKKTMRMMTALGAFFVIAVVVAGCGSSSVPKSDVATVAGNPISKQAFNHWMYIAEKGNSVEDGGPVIVPTDPPNFTSCIAQVREQITEYAKTPAATLRADCKELFTQLNATVMDFLVKAYWYQATAHKDGIKITQKELTTAYNAAAKQTFPTAAEHTEYLTETGQTQADLSYRIRVQVVLSKLIARIAPKITPAVIKKYYDAHASSYGTPETRNILLIQTTSKSQIDAAQAALKSGQSWATVAKKYSTNTASKAAGGVIKSVPSSGTLEAAVSKVIFASSLNQLKGPIKGTFGYYLVEVTKITPATKEPIATADAAIKETLTEQYDTSAETKINAAVKKQWGAQTRCSATYSMDDCAGYKKPKTTTTTASTTPTTAASSGATATSTVTTTSTATATTPSTTTTTK